MCHSQVLVHALCRPVMSFLACIILYASIPYGGRSEEVGHANREVKVTGYSASCSPPCAILHRLGAAIVWSYIA